MILWVQCSSYLGVSPKWDSAYPSQNCSQTGLRDQPISPKKVSKKNQVAKSVLIWLAHMFFTKNQWRRVTWKMPRGVPEGRRSTWSQLGRWGWRHREGNGWQHTHCSTKYGQTLDLLFNFFGCVHLYKDVFLETVFFQAAQSLQVLAVFVA